MLGWLKRLWSRDQDRLIFSFRDGTKERRVDPLAVLNQLEATCPEWVGLLEQSQPPAGPLMPGPVMDEVTKGRKAAVAKLIEVSRTIFGVKPLDDTAGLTEAETLGLFTAYLAFMGGLAEEARPLPVSPLAESPSPAASPTGSSAVCTMTGI